MEEDRSLEFEKYGPEGYWPYADRASAPRRLIDGFESISIAKDRLKEQAKLDIKPVSKEAVLSRAISTKEAFEYTKNKKACRLHRSDFIDALEEVEREEAKVQPIEQEAK